MKRIYLITAFLFSIVAVQAQTDPRTKAVLDAVTAKLKAVNGVTANFHLITKSHAGKTLNNVTGTVAIKGDKYYIKQGKSEIFSDGVKTWNYNGIDAVTITKVSEEAQEISPKTFLSNFYDKDYASKLVSTTAAYFEIQLVPNDKRKNYQKVNVFVDKQKKIITRAKVEDKSNNTVDFTMANVNTNATIADSKFVFDKARYPKNIEVIE